MNSDSFSIFWASISNVIPHQYVSYIAIFVTSIVTLCSVVIRFWKPPVSTSKLFKVWTVVSWIAQARGWAAPAFLEGAEELKNDFKSFENNLPKTESK